MKISAKMKGLTHNETKVFIDGKEIEGLIGFDISVGVDRDPIANIKVYLNELDVEFDEMNEVEKYYNAHEGKDRYTLNRQNNKMERTVREAMRYVSRIEDEDDNIKRTTLYDSLRVLLKRSLPKDKK